MKYNINPGAQWPNTLKIDGAGPFTPHVREHRQVEPATVEVTVDVIWSSPKPPAKKPKLELAGYHGGVGDDAGIIVDGRLRLQLLLPYGITEYRTTPGGSQTP